MNPQERHASMLRLAERYQLLLYFSMLRVKAKIKALHRNFREFVTFLETFGVNLQAESGLVTVNSTYWAYVGLETNLEYYFRHVGFPWYEECVELWDVRGAASVLIEAGERLYDPIMFDDTDDEYEAAGDGNGADGGHGAEVAVGNEDGDGADGVDYMNGTANKEEAGEEEYEEENVAEAAAVELVDIESDEAPDEMDMDTDVDSCVDSD
ncbi:shaggy-like protein kinase 41 [Striga asiatica]|uniref:Shaggy-like protein kinase 41 n=1 Tax=Striga asiatica TaxID=4170 RepID=A0A5A7Q9V9_STRAF|nr:shaggy-like protein kinase 41 [Striga asiatica]